jgi:hypothetical protein
MRPDMMRNAARYWLTLSVTTPVRDHHQHVMKLFSRMNGIEMPSTPRW